MRLWLAGLVGIMITGTLVVIRPADSDAAGHDVEDATVAPNNCERYGEMTNLIVAARFPEPKADPKASILAEDGGYSGYAHVLECTGLESTLLV